VESRLEAGSGGKLRAKTITRLGRIVVREAFDDNPDPGRIAAALADRVRAEGLGLLSWGEAAQRLRERVAFLRRSAPDQWPDLSDAGLIARVGEWLEPLLPGRRGLADIAAPDLEGALRSLIPWDAQRRLDAEAPTHWTAPTGQRHPIDYAAEGGPRLSVRVQELFGLAEHPVIAGAPLTFSLLSPAHRPIQTTRDLPGFWKGSWRDVRAEMRGRYPRHPWPEDPQNAPPTTRAKPRS